MKAHIIPESYLHGFVDPETPAGETPLLHLYDFSTNSWKWKAPGNTLWQTDYYALPGKEGKAKDALDHGPMGAIEGRAAAIVRNKIARKLPLTIEEKREYASFLGLMMGRVPAHRERVDRIIEEFSTQPTRLMAKHNRERFERMSDAFERRTGQKAPTAEQWAMIDEGKISVRATQGQQLQGMAGVMDVVPEALARMRWIFFHSAPPNWFITSDNPVSLQVSSQPELGFGLGRSDIRVSFPVTRNIELIATWPQDGETDNEIHRDLAALAESFPGLALNIGDEPLKAGNALQIGYATQYIAAPARTFLSAEFLDHKSALPSFFHDLAAGGLDDIRDKDRQDPSDE